jgi:hypothetical protein
LALGFVVGQRPGPFLAYAGDLDGKISEIVSVVKYGVFFYDKKEFRFY